MRTQTASLTDIRPPLASVGLYPLESPLPSAVHRGCNRKGKGDPERNGRERGGYESHRPRPGPACRPGRQVHPPGRTIGKAEGRPARGDGRAVRHKEGPQGPALPHRVPARGQVRQVEPQAPGLRHSLPAHQPPQGPARQAQHPGQQLPGQQHPGHHPNQHLPAQHPCHQPAPTPDRSLGQSAPPASRQ